MMTESAATTDEGSNRPVAEIAISRWWRFAKFDQPLVTTAGVSMLVVFRGDWSHGLGPDFAGAMIALERGELLSGSIEIHRHSSDWRNHGHDRDPAYNDVILHAVLEDDGIPTRRADGKLVPVVVLPVRDEDLHQPDWGDGSWAAVGGEVCAEQLVSINPGIVRKAIWELGDRRLAGKTARIEAQLSGEEPAGVLYRELLDGLGYSANRGPMRQLASIAPIGVLVALQSTVDESDRELLSLAVLSGTSPIRAIANAA